MNVGKSTYDAVVIGAGLGGLVIANHLERKGWRVALIDEQEQSGGFCRGREVNSSLMEFGIKMIPQKNWEAQLFDEILVSLASDSGGYERIQESPQIFESGKWVPFLGFGANAPSFFDELDYYLAGDFISWSKGPAYWVQTLRESLKTADILNKGAVTQLVTEKGRVESLLINGQKKLVAKEIIYCAPLPRLMKMISGDCGVPRWQQRISKRSFWTSISLGMIVNETVSTSKGIHLLKGNDPEEVFWGVFTPTQIADQKPRQITQWMTLMRSEETDLEEAVGTAIRKMRKLLSKAFPATANKVEFERILVADESHGLIQLPQGEAVCWPSLSNLWLGTHNVSLQRNLVGVISQAKKILDHLVGDLARGMQPSEKGLELSVEDHGNVRCSQTNAEETLWRNVGSGDLSPISS